MITFMKPYSEAKTYKITLFIIVFYFLQTAGESRISQINQNVLITYLLSKKRGDKCRMLSCKASLMNHFLDIA